MREVLTTQGWVDYGYINVYERVQRFAVDMAVTARHGRPSSGSRRAGARRDDSNVLELQRSRMIAAVIGTVEAGGYSNLTVEKVITRARVSRKTFYEAFADAEDCLLAAFEQTLERASELARAAYAGEPDWRSGMRAATFCLLSLQELADAIDGGRAVANARHDPQPLTAQAVAGGIVAVLHTRMLRKGGEPVTDLLGPLMSMIVLPYLGRALAHEEFNAPKPRSPTENGQAPPTTGPDPLEQLDMRLTYRTIRVLTAIAEAPDTSNRQIAQAAGIIDQGQISKLLRRLAGLGLIENGQPRRIDHGANAWRLTDLGAQVHRAAKGCR
jgi:AcrR family transcriptional regulator